MDKIEKLKNAIKGWDGYGWKDDEYIDDLEEFFKNVINDIDKKPSENITEKLF